MCRVRLLGQQGIENFKDSNSQSARTLDRWSAIVRAAEWKSLVDVKKTFNTADYVAPYTVFNIGGNNFRLIAIIDFKESVVVVQSVMAHKEYDKWRP